MSRNICHVLWLGQVEYQRAWELQSFLALARGTGSVKDILLLLEHPPTYTLGRKGEEAHLLVSPQSLAQQGVKVLRVDRGGDITFHGPGQLVGYPVLDLGVYGMDVKEYLRALEETLIRALANFGIGAFRLPGYTGVWVGNEKIAAIGVKLDARGITSHGFALNVTNELNYFSHIVPCGIRDKGVTSMAQVLGDEIPLLDVAAQVVEAFGEVFQGSMVRGGNAMNELVREFTRNDGRAQIGGILH